MIKKLQKNSFYEVEDPGNFSSKFTISYKNKVKKRIKPRTFEDRMKIVVEGQGKLDSIEEICLKENINPLEFHQWTQELLEFKDLKVEDSDEVLSKVDKLKIVIEGRTGETSIAEICRRENISHDEFMEWSLSFLKERRVKLKEFEIANNPIYQNSRNLVLKGSSEEVFEYSDNFIDFRSKDALVVFKSDSRRLEFNKNLESIVSLQRINDVRYINKFFEKINSKLSDDGVFIGCFETLNTRRLRKSINKIPLINNVYFSFEFLFKRILPKVSFTKKHYFDITKGNDRLLSKAEGLGRLVSCGFKIMDFKTIDGLLYFVVKKVSEPNFDMNPSYGPLYKMPRVGKDGNIIKVYKFRTMHPYSEYLQEFMVKSYGYSKTGKPSNDFRIPYWGNVMRKYWLDELPQLINVLKGDMKLVGVRPLSLYRFEEIPREMQKLRLPQKPGCIPPYISYNMESDVVSLLQAEKEYIEEKTQNPKFTDIKCFFKAIYNIVFLHKRSA